MLFVDIAVEDSLSDAVLRATIRQTRDDVVVRHSYAKGGFGYLRRTIRGFNNAAKAASYVVLADLDQMECPPRLIAEWLQCPKHPNLLFRVAVREVESWVLAHREAFAEWLGVAVSKIPPNPDALSDPKQFLVNLARRSRLRALRAAIVPRPGSTAIVGPDYNGVLVKFVEQSWSAHAAAANSASLQRAIAALAQFHRQD